MNEVVTNISFNLRSEKAKILESDALARLSFEALSDKLADDIIILDIRPVSVMADFFVLATAGSRRQLKVLVEAVADRVRQEGYRKATRVEGEPESGWILADFDDVVVHVFDAEHRAYYDLEGLWAEAPLVARMP